MGDIITKNKLYIFFSAFALVCILIFVSLVHRCSNTSVLPHYGNPEYTFVLCTVGSGRSERFYAGTISQTDYQRWIDGESGTIFVHLATDPSRGYQLSISSITTISDKGSTPEWLPMNFVGQ